MVSNEQQLELPWNIHSSEELFTCAGAEDKSFVFSSVISSSTAWSYWDGLLLKLPTEMAIETYSNEIKA